MALININLLKGIYSRFNPDFKKPTRTVKDLEKIPSGSLLRYYSNVYSQVGQDGIIREIFRRLDIEKGYFCEFGAWDGVLHSNTRWLYEIGWDGLYIEPDMKKFKVLKKNISIQNKKDQIRCYQGFVGYDEKNEDKLKLDKIFKKYSCPKDIDLLVVDIDGYDLEVFLAGNVRPKLVVMEGGTNLNPNINKPFEYFKIHQHPLTYISNSMNKKGYKLICFLQDSFFIRSDFFDKLNLFNISLKPKDLYKDHFNFRGEEFRNSIINLRKNSERIKLLEQNLIGKFEPDPTFDF